MDILYYSNYCKHSQKIIQYVSKNGLAEKLNCICIDRRMKDPQTNQTVVILQNNKRVVIPPNVHSVPALLIVKQNYNAIFGEDIIQYFTPAVSTTNSMANRANGEPSTYSFRMGSSAYITSEQYTFYNLTPEELSAKGNGGRRPMYNYVPASQTIPLIDTPPDTYQPDKLGDVQLDQIQQTRNADVVGSNKPLFI